MAGSSSSNQSRKGEAVAQQFTLALVNPAISAPNPQNEIFTGLSGGNQLNVTMTNNSGFDTEFGGSSTGDLLVKFPKNIIDAQSLKAVTVASPWTTDGIYTPDDDPDPQDEQGYFVLKLKPPASVPFANNGSVTVSLANLSPTAKGNASLFTTYDFSDLGLPMDVSSQLTVEGSSKPDNKPLIGDANALRFTLKVNDGPATNSIVVTESPVTSKNAAENTLHLNFDFQDQNLPPGNDGQQTLGQLVPSWDPDNPPTFRIQFPYFNAQSVFPAPLDLTDDVKAGQPNYNEYTSAWNIKLSLSQSNPDVRQNNWWTITPDSKSPVPSWLVQPTAANKYLFTGTTSGPTGSGPFLDLFFSHIYSALPIDPGRPESILYVQTYNFPGFNDRLQQLPLFKESSVQISGFCGEFQISGGVTTLVLSWQTNNAKYCLVSGDSTQQGASSQGDYTRPIGLSKKLASTYALTAFGNDGVSQIQKTIGVQWMEAPSMSPTSFQNPSGIDISPDGNSVYVAANGVLNVLTASTLLEAGSPLTLPNQASVQNVIATSDGGRLFLAVNPFGGGGLIQAFTSTLKPLPISPANPGLNDAPDLYPMALSADGKQLVISAAYPEGQDAQFIAAYDTADLSLSQGSPLNLPTLRQMGLAIKGNNLYYPDKGGLGVVNRTTFAPLPGSPVSLKATDDVSYTPGPLTVSPDGNTVATLALGLIDNSRVFILCLVDIPSMALTKRVQVYTGYANAPSVTTTGISFSLDGKYLFVFGTDYLTKPPKINNTVFSVFDATSLQELPWSPVAVSKFYGDFVMAPDGSRLYVTTLDNGTAASGPVAELIPCFPQE
jgi:hypothetical protein